MNLFASNHSFIHWQDQASISIAAHINVLNVRHVVLGSGATVTTNPFPVIDCSRSSSSRISDRMRENRDDHEPPHAQDPAKESIPTGTGPVVREKLMLLD